MSGLSAGILSNAVPLSPTQVKGLEQQVLENKKAYSYLNENGEICFALPSSPQGIKDLAWHKADELFTLTGSTFDEDTQETVEEFTFQFKNIYTNTGADACIAKSILGRTSNDTDWLSLEFATGGTQLKAQNDLVPANCIIYRMSDDYSYSSFLAAGDTLPQLKLGDFLVYGNSTTALTNPINHIIYCVTQDPCDFRSLEDLKRDLWCRVHLTSMLDSGTTATLSYTAKQLVETLIPDSDVTDDILEALLDELCIELYGSPSDRLVNSKSTVEPFWAIVNAAALDKPNTSTSSYIYELFTVIFGVPVRQLGMLPISSFGLTRVPLPFTINRIAHLSGLKSFDISSFDTVKFYSRSAAESDITQVVNAFYSNNSRLDIHAEIYPGAFDSCKSLSRFDFIIDYLSEDAFTNCESLKKVNLSNRLREIPSAAFNGCSSLSSITIPNSVKSIGDFAFARCSALGVITIPSSVTFIGEYAFGWCYKISEIYFAGTVNQWNSVTKSQDWSRNTLATYVQCSDGQVAI